MNRKTYTISNSQNWLMNLNEFKRIFQWETIEDVEHFHEQPLIVGGFEHMKWQQISFKNILRMDKLKPFLDSQPHLFEFIKENHILETALRNTLQYSGSDIFNEYVPKILEIHPALDFNSAYEFIEPPLSLSKSINPEVYKGEKIEGNLNFMDLALLFGLSDTFDFLAERGISYNKKRNKNPYGIIQDEKLLKKIVAHPDFGYEELFKLYSDDNVDFIPLFSSSIEKKIAIVTKNWEANKVLDAERETFFHKEHIERLFQMKDSNFSSDSSGYAFSIRKIQENPEWLKEPISITYKEHHFKTMKETLLTLNVDSLTNAINNIEKEDVLKKNIKSNKTSTIFSRRF